jgi:Reverse transcriptase (RNA-dependent DNA polymerase)
MLFYLRQGRTKVLVALWVDDFLYLSTRNSILAEKLLENIKKTYLLKQTTGAILGMELQITSNTISIGHKKYIERKCQEFGITHSKSAYSPMETGLVLEPAKISNNQPYSNLIGSLMHSMVAARPDIAHACGVLARFGSCHDETHYQAGLRVLRYLWTTKHYQITYPVSKKLEFEAFCDADFGSDVSARSTSGLILLVNKSPIIWRSKLQSCVTISTAEAETVSACEAAVLIMWIRNILEELGYDMGSTTLWEDNNAAIAIATKPERKSRIRHMHVKYMYLQEKVSEGSIQVKRIDTDKQIADMFTKALPKLKLLEFVKTIGMNISIRGSVDHNVQNTIVPT